MRSIADLRREYNAIGPDERDPLCARCERRREAQPAEQRSLIAHKVRRCDSYRRAHEDELRRLEPNLRARRRAEVDRQVGREVLAVQRCKTLWSVCHRWKKGRREAECTEHAGFAVA